MCDKSPTARSMKPESVLKELNFSTLFFRSLRMQYDVDYHCGIRDTFVN